MQREEVVEDSHPAVTGHSFEVASYDLCLNCHALPEGDVMFTQFAVARLINDVKYHLDYWATNMAPPALAQKYGVLAWEYTNPGELSSGSQGPNSTEQGLIPDNIKKARFNLYLVRYDGSFGVHNPKYSITLLETARKFVRLELDE
jgi:hypothetical protein